jgi:ParB-like chromosome segregation protein Spo0J
MKKLLAKADKELAEVNRLLGKLRKRIARTVEDVRLATKKAEKAEKADITHAHKKARAKGR